MGQLSSCLFNTFTVTVATGTFSIQLHKKHCTSAAAHFLCRGPSYLTNKEKKAHPCPNTRGWWQCWQMAALTYLLMMFRSRLKSILHSAPADIKTARERCSALWVFVSATWRRSSHQYPSLAATAAVCVMKRWAALSQSLRRFDFHGIPEGKSRYDELCSRAAGDILRRIPHRSPTAEVPLRRVANSPSEKRNVLVSCSLTKEASSRCLCLCSAQLNGNSQSRPRGVHRARIEWQSCACALTLLAYPRVKRRIVE